MAKGGGLDWDQLGEDLYFVFATPHVLSILPTSADIICNQEHYHLHPQRPQNELPCALDCKPWPLHGHRRISQALSSDLTERSVC